MLESRYVKLLINGITAASFITIRKKTLFLDSFSLKISFTCTQSYYARHSPAIVNNFIFSVLLKDVDGTEITP